MMRRVWGLGLVTFTFLVVGGLVLSHDKRGEKMKKPLPEIELAFNGDSEDLAATRVALTLDAPIEKGANTMWCGSFLGALKKLEKDVAKEQILLQGAPDLAKLMASAADPRGSLPAEKSYLAAGWVDKGILEEIAGALEEKFPGKAKPGFPGILPNSFVAYSYVEVNLSFDIPYFQSREPLAFVDGRGIRTDINSFGIRAEDEYAYDELRRQPKILYVRNDETRWGPRVECVVDLDQASEPDQIILAMLKPRATLAETLTAVQKRIEKGAEIPVEMGPNDMLLVPDMVWEISHHFAELEGKRFENKSLREQPIDCAQQDISFRLNRSGAELKSEAKMYAAPIPTCYVFDRPFLLMMKKRGAEMPFLVSWVGNAELLSKWDGGDSEPD